MRVETCSRQKQNTYPTNSFVSVELGRVVASLGKTLCDNFFCLVVSDKQQILENLLREKNYTLGLVSKKKQNIYF